MPSDPANSRPLSHRNIALYGQSGAGKTSIAEYLVERHGFARCSTGAMCRHICRVLFNSEAKTLLNQVTDALKAIDEDVWLRAALVQAPPGRSIVFDSMRFASDYRFLAENGFATWKIVAPLDVRLMRLRLRQQEFDPVIDDNHRGEVELATYSFDVEVDNGSATLPDLYQRIEAELAR